MGVRLRQCIITMLGYYVLPRGDVAVSTKTFVEALQPIGTTERAIRAAIDRMADEGHLIRYKHGRKAYYQVEDAWAQRIRDAVLRVHSWMRDVETPASWWTLLSFSIPEARRGDRHLLRTELAWRGFGPFRDGTWLAPHEAHVEDVLAERDLLDFAEVLLVRPPDADQARRLIDRMWDLDELRAMCDELAHRWSAGTPPDDPLAHHILIMTEWRQLLRRHPQISLSLLPPDWPLQRCADLLSDFDSALSLPARSRFTDVLETLPADR